MDTSFKDHFSTLAGGYAIYRPRYPAALAEFLAGISPSRGLAWDAGCGSGQLTGVLGDFFDRVIGTDASEEQISQATPHRNVEYRLATAEASGLETKSVDLAVAAQAAHWFDLDRYYAEVRRVGKENGIIALVTYSGMTIEPSIDQLVDRFYHVDLKGHWPPERRLVEEGYRSMPFPFDEIQAPPLAMRSDWTLSDVIGYVDTWSAVKNLVKAGGIGAVEKLRSDLAGVWGPPEVAKVISRELSLRVGRI
jgi:SAM-dependent methyltransferase